jgi:hypothetical protein
MGICSHLPYCAKVGKAVVTSIEAAKTTQIKTEES